MCVCVDVCVCGVSFPPPQTPLNHNQLVAVYMEDVKEVIRVFDLEVRCRCLLPSRRCPVAELWACARETYDAVSGAQREWERDGERGRETYEGLGAQREGERERETERKKRAVEKTESATVGGTERVRHGEGCRARGPVAVAMTVTGALTVTVAVAVTVTGL